MNPSNALPRCSAPNRRVNARRNARGSTSSSRSRKAVSDGARTTPYKLFRFARTRSVCRASRSNCNNDGYFSAKIAKPDIKQSVRFSPRLTTGSSMRPKLARTWRSKPGMLNVLRKRSLDMIHDPMVENTAS